MNRTLHRVLCKAVCAALMLGTGALTPASAASTVTLADQPVFASADVPGNLALTLSVEFPTAISVANLGDYADASTYLGYFDPLKCYNYSYNTTTPSSSFFQPAALATGTYLHSCSGMWSGNFMNWATMQTIDPFRWALSGGYRSVDTTSQTILEKAWGSTQGALTNFPLRGSLMSSGNNLPSALIPKVTPFNTWVGFNTSIWSRGNLMVFGSTLALVGAVTNTALDLSNLPVANTLVGSLFAYRVYVRVRVCDSTTTMGTGGLETNCVMYGTNYKPEGLLQQYSNKIRFSAFSYLNGDGANRQGGVLREPMGFIGPTYPQPLSTSVNTNSRPEWSAGTGIQSTNPDTASATASGVSQSGVMNYLNKFGEAGQSYMTDDNVGELYYAAVRYFENLGNVPEWTNSATTTQLDGFPAVTSWTDPIAYSCQKNFILGIGDDHTHYDYNVGTGTAPSGVTVATGGRAKPAAVSSDTLNQAASWTASLQNLQGITQTPWWIQGSGATYYLAGLAYGTHVNDIRADLTGTQTISTYWMDVAEYQELDNLNPYYLATKFGGFTVPANYTIPTALTKSSWDTSGNTIYMSGYNQDQPDNYFLAGNASQMVSGLKSAFSNIASAVQAYTTAVSLTTPNTASSGSASFASQYTATGWTSVVTAETLSFASDGTPTITPTWATNNTLQTQFAGTGWNTSRNIVTWNGSAGAALRTGSLTSTQLATLLPSYSSATTSAQYLNYLRGDQSNEVGSTATSSTKSLRARTLLLGDIADSKLTPVSTPTMTYAEASNVGYAAFKTQWTTTTPRPTMVYAGANDGMLHAFVGSSGTEQFAYVPSAVFQGPNGTPQVDGLAQLGNPNYSHHFYVDATPLAFDIDFNNAGGAFATTSSANSDWHTLLIGGLGKGGKSYYAIDVTNPTSMSSETAVAGDVLWEFTDSTMGYSFGAPVVVKTAKYGWVVALTSGYNNSDGYGYLYLVNPKTGALLEKIATPSASAGLTQASAYVIDYTDYTADSIYVGDLNGQLWRFDLTAAKGTTAAYPSPTLLATVADASGNAQPITTAPLIEIHPTTRKRFVMFGTGRLLASTDVISTAAQSFYSIIDGTAGGFNTVSTPITRASLSVLADVTVGITLSATSKGWYIDLGADVSSGIAYRVVINPAAYNGVVAFATLLTVGDACSPSGKSQVYALNYATGTTILSASTTTGTTVVTTPVAYTTYATAIVDLRFVSVTTTTGTTTTSTPELIAGQSSGAVVNLNANLTSTIATRLLNWREVPTAD